MDSDGHVIGVSQVMNKLNGRIFTEEDVAIIEVNLSFFLIINYQNKIIII